jgi:hypothetical protein
MRVEPGGFVNVRIVMAYRQPVDNRMFSMCCADADIPRTLIEPSTATFLDTKTLYFHWIGLRVGGVDSLVSNLASMPAL